MGLNHDAAGAVSSPAMRTWTTSDCVIYALGVGAGTSELRFATDDTRGCAATALPTMAVVLAVPGPEIARAMGDYDRSKLVHGSQTTIVHSPVPAAGSIRYTTSITGIYDKGSGATVETETVAIDSASDEPVFTNRSVAFIRGEGGWGGDRGPATAKTPLPDRAPDWNVEFAIAGNQALIYRLSGDRNPLHSDPRSARAAGFDRPILHGLCTYGFVGRALLDHACSGDLDQFRTMSARFVAPVYPGDRLSVAMWSLGDGNTAFEGHRNGTELVITGGLGNRFG
jgi:acyl dehydratase